MGLAGAWRTLAWGLLAVIALSQTAALVGLASRRVETDRGSAWALVLSWYAVLAAALLEGWLLPLPAALATWFEAGGLACFAIGTLGRFWAVASLAGQFSPLVELQPEHVLVTRGPYAWVRHPAYAGSLLWALAVPLALAAPWALGAVAILYVPALVYRIGVEERLLEERFGDRFRSYRQQVPALVPRPWRHYAGDRAPGSAGTGGV